MDREVLAPLNEWLLQYDKMLVSPLCSLLAFVASFAGMCVCQMHMHAIDAVEGLLPAVAGNNKLACIYDISQAGLTKTLRTEHAHACAAQQWRLMLCCRLCTGLQRM